MHSNKPESEQARQLFSSCNAALYVRLSKDDGKKQESNSVVSQKEILKEFLKLHPEIRLYDFYIDDGWSGTNFDRPDFKRMIEDIRSGKVNCVIVKDLSRFGRNYTDAGYYIDNMFVRHGVRFISINNSLDTASNNMNAAMQCVNVGVTNVINESVAATTSVNVRATLNVRRTNGKFIGSFPTYGYLKDPEDYHRLIIDEETAPVVRMIFEKFISGTSIIGITKELNNLGIPNPSTYKKQKGFNYMHPSSDISDGLWPESSVRRVLKNEMYIGNMVQGKNTKMSYKIKQCVSVPKEDWFIVEGTHEPIIDKDTFEKAQSLFNKNIRKSPGNNEVGLFAGLVKCADCHRIMSKKSNKHSYGEYHYYRCTTARKIKNGVCTNHTIRIDKLEEAVLVSIQKMIDIAVEYEEMVRKINTHPQKKQKSDRYENALKKKIAEREKYNKMAHELYPDLKLGRITEEEYIIYKNEVSEKLADINKSVEALKNAVAEINNGMEKNPFIEKFKKIGNIETLNRVIVTELIEEILVHEGGRITIRFRCKDSFEQLLEYIELNKDIVKTA